MANAVAQKALELEELHALAMQTLEAEHKTALIAAKAASAGEAGADASPSEKQLREKLGEAVGALEVSNAQCKSLKKKLAESRGELAKVKNITAKAAEVLESRGADQKLIKSLKKELDVALELEAAAEKRAEYAEKEAAKLKAQSLSGEPKGSSLDVLQLEKELEEAHEVIAEFKASWEADRKVIAILSKMKDASPDAPDARDDAKRASEAASESAAKSANLWDLAKKYGKKTLALIGAEEGETPGGEASGVRTRDVAAETLRASAAKRNNTLAAGPGFPASGPGEYSRVGGSATIKRLRQNAETNEAFVDEGARVRQLKWLAAAEQATEAATAYVEPPAAPAAPASAPAACPPAAAAPRRRRPRPSPPPRRPRRPRRSRTTRSPRSRPRVTSRSASPRRSAPRPRPPPRRRRRRRRLRRRRRRAPRRRDAKVADGAPRRLAARRRRERREGCRRRAVHALNRHSAREGGRRAEGRRRRRVERRAPSPGPLNGKYGEGGRLEGVLRSGATGRGFLHAHFECRGKVARERDERTNERTSAPGNERGDASASARTSAGTRTGGTLSATRARLISAESRRRDARLIFM